MGIQQAQGIPIQDQILIFAGKLLSVEETISDCNIENNCTLHLLWRIYPEEDNMKLENLEMDKVADIQIESDQMIALLSESMQAYKINAPKSVLEIVYEYARCVGG